MQSVSVIVAYRGKWSLENQYTNFGFQSVFIPEDASLKFLQECLCEELNLELFGFNVGVHSLLLFVGRKLKDPIEIVSDLKRDDDVKLFLNLVRHSKEALRYPLVIDFVSSSVSAVGSISSSSCFISSRDEASSFNADGSVCQFEDDIDVAMNNFLIEDLDISKLPMSFDVNVGNQFMSKSVLKKFMHVIAIRRHFEFKSERSNNSFYVLVCKNESCTWKMRAAKVSNGNVWEVKKYIKEHTCSLDVASAEHRQANSRVVSEFLKGDFSIGLAERLYPNDLRSIMHGKHGVEISYYKARMAHRYALASMRGSAVESYASIPFMCNVFKEKNPDNLCYLKNPGYAYGFVQWSRSVTSYKLDNDGRFKPVILVDDTSLKNEFSGTLLLSAVLDADNHIFPLGFAIVDSENDSSWEWFFERLKEAIRTREELVIISDRKSSIPKAVEKVFSDASHEFCMQHLLRNLNSNFKSVHVDAIFYRCAKTYRKEDFGYFMRQLEAVRPAIQNYLMQVGVEKWARAYFERKRYDVMTTNISESLNNVLVNAREYSIEALIEHFRSLLQRWFYERRNKADQTFIYFSKHATKYLRDRKKIARCLSVQPMDINKYYVVDGLVGEMVDLVAKTCSCLVWQVDEFPCPHAIASIWKRNLDPAHFTSYYYTNNAFKATYDVGSELEVVLPPEFKRGAGRPRKQRILSSGEREKQYVKCSRCKQVGHNRRTCSNPTFVYMN
ncbi:uncharacterized protein LOC112093061 [Morus notabilis]|uniref:uncharacterized protein LOC112093061 n=1 Tax=Morus notabilis TaxID=981085 RepID=UPI000CED2796|nr:uncharacterized protein LOC112093061 [Morus notabilis]